VFRPGDEYAAPGHHVPRVPAPHRRERGR
jgi:Plasmid encoded RepA protein.